MTTNYFAYRGKHYFTCILVSCLSLFVCDCYAVDAISAKLIDAKGIQYPTPAAGQTDADQIKHGEYLARVGECLSCHTNHDQQGKPYAGGVAMETSAGVFYTSNITSDLETGIGTWSDADFIRAMREGISPRGYHYFPVFPYRYFAKLSDEDLVAIKAYLFSLPAVWQKNKQIDAPWPYNQRGTMAWWNLWFAGDSHPYVYDRKASKAWNRGAYLVEGVGHCGNCHTPTNHFAAPLAKYALQGNVLGQIYAPNITNRPLSEQAQYDITATYARGQQQSLREYTTDALQATQHEGLVAMNDDDLSAVLTYLQHIHKDRPAATPARLRSGRATYNKVCAGCHERGELNAPMLVQKATWMAIAEKGVPLIVQNTLAGINGMPAKGGCVDCSPAEVTAAVVYMLEQAIPGSDYSLWNRKSKQYVWDPVAVHQIDYSQYRAPTVPAKQVKVTAEDGKRVYDEVCSVCHNGGLLQAPKVSDKKAWQQRLKDGVAAPIQHTIGGLGAMPPKGGCVNCTNSEVVAATIYLLQQTGVKADYSLWSR